jgi:hypothetical protein
MSTIKIKTEASATRSSILVVMKSEASIERQKRKWGAVDTANEVMFVAK